MSQLNTAAWPETGDKAQKIAFIHRLLRSYRFPVHDEKHTQTHIEQALTRHGVPFAREQKLESAGTIDFLIDGTIGVEVKIKGAKMAIYRQCRRYCETGLLTHLVLFSLVAMTLPEQLDDIPTSVVTMGAAFLR